MTASYYYDVVILSDFRYTGGNSASIAEEVKAQHAAGLRTALLQLPSRRLKQARPISPRIKALLHRGQARLLAPTVPSVRATTMIFRHPLPAEAAHELPTKVEAGSAVLVVNQPLYGLDGTHNDIDIHASSRSIRSLTGITPSVTPIGPWVRDQLPPEFHEVVHAEDWVNVIRPEEWVVRRGSPQGPPIVGRHSRDDWTKWPEDVDAIKCAWPPESSWDIRILGGAKAPIDLLGYQPSNWSVYPFGSIDPLSFLASLHYYVYFHHARSLEAFGRSTLEALATGCIVITHSEYERLFGTGALYAQPADVLGLIEHFHAHPAAADQQRQAALKVVQDHFSHAAHLNRLSALGVHPPEPQTQGVPPRNRRPQSPTQVTSDAASRGHSVRGLLVSSNGAGIGHLVRTLALARRFPTTLSSLFLTMSEGIWLPQQWGFPAERMPSSNQLGASPTHWNAWFRERTISLAHAYGASFVLFDGTVPYAGLLEAVERLSIPWFWLRRPMWKADAPSNSLDRGKGATAIIEPGDIAAEFDKGPTTDCRDAAYRLADPVLLLRANEVQSRDAARSHLALGPRETAVLVTLGAANLTDQYDPLADALKLLQAHPNARVFVTTSPLTSSRSLNQTVSHCEVLSHYPLAELMPAFDFAISAAGYNTFHELFVARTPTIFLPTLETAVDDQHARARFAQSTGSGLCVMPGDIDALQEALNVMTDPDKRAYFQANLEEFAIGDGATSAVHLLLESLDLVGHEKA